MTTATYDIGNGIRQRASRLRRLWAHMPNNPPHAHGSQQALQALDFAGRQLMRSDDLSTVFSSHSTVAMAMTVLYCDAERTLTSFVSRQVYRQVETKPPAIRFPAAFLKEWQRNHSISSVHAGLDDPKWHKLSLWHLIGLHKLLKGMEHLQIQLGQRLYEGDYILHAQAMESVHVRVHDLCFLARQMQGLTPMPPWFQEVAP